MYLESKLDLARYHTQDLLICFKEIRRLCDLKFDFEIFLNFLIQTGYFNDNIQKLKSKHYRNNGAKATVVDPML